jgi:uncharacterized repeat protein (TIGR01451 family)
VTAFAVDKDAAGTVYAGQVGSGVIKSADHGATWTATAATQTYTNALVMDPTTTGANAVLYEGSRFGGVQRITGGGSTHTFITSGLGNFNVLSLVLDPANNNILYAGTNGSGVWVSSNVNGPTPTWAQKPTAGLGNTVINALAIDATGNLYAGTNSGVYQLAPGGASWTTVAGGPAGFTVLSLAIDSSSNVYAASFGGGLFKLSAGVWTTLNGSGGTALGTLNLRAVAVDPVTPSTIYAAGRSRNGIYKSTDGGATWSLSSAGLAITSAQALAIDPASTGNVYVGMVNIMSFVAKFNSSGSPTVLSFFGGGSGSTQPFTVAVDNPTSQNMYIGGLTSTANLPTPLVGQTTIGGNTDGFVAKISTVGPPAVVWDRYLGGTFDDVVYSLALDQSGNVDVTGYTTSADFPVTLATAYQTSLKGTPNIAANAFVTEINPSGDTLLYSTYFGGTGGDDEGTGIAVLSAGSVASINVTAGGSGYASTPTVTITGGGGSGATATATLTGGVVTGFTITNPGSGYVVVPGVAITGGGGAGATATAVLSATSPLISVAGLTFSTDLPTANPTQSVTAGGYDTFYARFDPSKSGAPGLLFSTYLGGNSDDFAFSLNNLALDSLGAAWITGQTYSTNFPITALSAVQPAGSSTVTTSGDAFVYKIQTTGNSSDLSLSMSSPAGATPAEGTTYAYTIHVANNGPNPAGAPSVVVSGAMPTNLTVNSVVAGQGTCLGLQTFTCSLGTVAFGGAGVDVTVNVTANTVPTPPVGPTMTATAQVSTADDDPVPANNVTSATVTVQRRADLTITGISSPASVTNGTAFSYSVTAANNGPSTGTGIIVSYPLPAGVTFNPPPSSSAGCALAAGTVTCPVANLTPFSSTVIVINVTPTVAGQLSATFTVSSPQVVDDGPGGGPGANNTPPPFTLTVRANVNLSLSAAVTSPVVPAGGSAAFKITVTNNGTDAATGVSLAANLPAGLSYLSFSSSAAGVSCSQDGPVFCSLPNIPGAGTVSFTIFASAVQQGTYAANLSVSSSVTDVAPGDNTTSATVTVVGALNSNLTTLLTDYETSTVQSYSGIPVPAPACCGQPTQVGASPANVVIAPNGRLAFTANVKGNYISVVDLTIQAEIARIRDVRAFSLAMTSDGQKLVAVGQLNDELDVVDIATLQLTKISLDGKVGDAVGVNDIDPFSLAVVGYQAYIANSFGPVIVVNFSNPALPVITTVAGTAGLLALHTGHQVAATPDSSTVAVFDHLNTGGAALIYLINTSTNTLSQTVTTTFGGARTIAITRNPNAASGVVAFLGFADGAIRVLDLRIGAGTYGQLLAGSVTPGTSITDMTLTPDGNTLQAVNGVAQGVSGPPSTLYTLNAALLVTSPLTSLQSSVAIQNSLSVRGLAIGYVQNFPLSSAPQVDDVVPQEITNEAPKLVRIFGDNFATGALVRIGNLDPLPATFVSPQEVTVTVPAGAAVQIGNIVVTLPNSAAGPLAANVSGGVLSGSGAKLQIDPPAAFAPLHPVAVSSFSAPKLSLLFRDSALLPGEVFSPSANISPDGLFAYSGGAIEFGITNLDTAQALPPLIGPGTAFFDCNTGLDGYAIAPDPTTGKKVLHFVGCDAATESSDTLYFVDVDPSSPTRNTLLPRTIQVPNTDFRGAQGLAATPDGLFVYSADVNATNGGTRLVIFDVLNSTSTIIPDITTLGADPSQQHIHVTPDGHSLLLSGAGGTTIKVYDIQGANATAPALVTTITGSLAPTTNPPLFYWFQVVGTRLFAYASDQRYVQVFNFDRVTPNFAPLGSYAIPSPAGRFSGEAMAVSPEGTLIYAVLENEDAVAVLDANLVALSSLNSLITKMRTMVNPANLAFSSRGNATADFQADISGSGQFLQSGTVLVTPNQPFDVSISVQNNSPSTASGVQMTLAIPAGVVANSAITSDGSIGNVACTISASQVVCPVGAFHNSDFVSIRITLTASALGSLVLTNTVSGNELDPNTANNAASLNVTVQNGADVGITISASPNPAVVGSPVALTMVVTNAGPDVASAASIQVTSSSNSLSNPSATQGSCFVEATLFCSLGDIAPGGSVTITATATYSTADTSSNGNGTVFLGASVFANSADPNFVNNFVSFNLPLTNPATPLQRWMVADRASGQIYILDPATNTPFGQSVDVGVSPDGIAVSPNHHIAFVSNLNATYISVVDVSIHKEIYRIRFGDAGVRNVAFTPDGSRVVAVLASAPKVLIIDAITFQVLQTIDLSAQTGGTLLGPAVVGHQAYVASTADSTIAVVDTNSFAVSTVSGTTGTPLSFVGNSVFAATPDGQYVVTVRSASTIQVISTASNSVVLTVSNGAIASNAKIAAGARTSAPLGTYGYFGTNVVNVLDLTPSAPTFGQVLSGKTVSLPFTAQDLAVSADGSQLYAINSANAGNNVAVVDTGALLSGAASLVFQGRYGGPCIAFNNCPASLRALAAANVDTLPIVGAPVITGVSPVFIFNDVPNTITISGSGFAPDARVRIGKTDGLPVTFVSSNQLQVTIPQGAPAHGDDVIVTNPNAPAGLPGQLLSGFLQGGVNNGSFEISGPLTYQPKFQAAVSDIGAGIVDFLRAFDGGRNGGSQIPVGTNPMGIAFSPDGTQFYVETFLLQSVVAGSPDCCQTSQMPQNTQIRLSGVPGQLAGLAVAPNPATGRPVALVSSMQPAAPAIPGDVQLNVIDADPFSPAVNSILYTIPAQLGSAQTPGGLALTSDGRYVYQNLASSATNPLVIFDTLARTATSIPDTSLGIAAFQPVVTVTADNQSLLLGDTTGNVKVFDISANPLSPTPVTTISGTIPPGLTSISLDVFTVVGSHLYTYDVTQRIVEIYNFNRATSNFSFVNYFKVPGSTPSTVGYAAEITVTPDESLIYVPSREDDLVAVIDAAKLISGGVQGDPTALVTSIATAQGPAAISLSPKRRDTAPEDFAIAISHSPDPVTVGDTITYNVTVSDFGPFPGSGHGGDSSGGFLINIDPSLIPISTSFSNSPFFDCGLSGGQLLCGFAHSGADPGPIPISISGNLVLRTTATGPVTVQGFIEGGNNSYDPNSANNSASDTVNVAPPQFALTITTAGAGSGTVTSNPAGISCPGTCLFSFTQGTLVTLTPAAPAGSAFAGWGGACTGTGACSVTMNTAQTVSATFNLITVTVTGAGTGNGTVTGTGGISCTSTVGATSGVCTNTSPISVGDTITLTATPASSLYVFAGWSGPCSGSGACTFTMGASAVTVTATFSFNSGATPTLVADYQFANVYTSSVGRDPALVDIGSGTNSFATDTVRGASQTVLVFPTGNGLQLSPTSGVFANVAYTIAALVRLDTISGYGRIFDFKNATSDDGLYDLDGNLVFFPEVGGSAAPIVAGAYVHVVLTRAADGTVTGYVNGVQQFSFVDSANLGVIDSSNVLRFFKDDNAVPNENSSGAVARIRIWDGALTAAQVAALEPPPTADLSVSVAPAGGSAATVTVTDLGPAAASNVVLTDTLDRFGFVSATPSQGGPCTFAAPVVTCPLGAIAAGASATVTMVVTAPSQGWAAQTLRAVSDALDPNPANNAARVGPALSSFNTPAGANVVVSAADSSGDTATVTFASVTRVGATTISASAATSPAPTGFRFGTPAVIYDVSSNADFAGPITVALRFNPASFHHPAKVHLFHLENGFWVDRTVGVNLAAATVSAVTSTLSPFIVVEPLNNPPVANAGSDHSVPGAMAAGARVTLDGSASTDADGDPLTYRWSGPFPEGGGTITGVNPTVTLPLGVSKVSLVVNDSEADSSAVALNLAVADFQVSAPAGSVTLARGQSTSFTITMTPQYGAFGAPINLSCAPGAADVTCSFSSASVTPGATASAATLTVTAAATVARAPRRSVPVYFALWLGTLPVFGVVFLAAGRRRKWQIAVLLMLLLLLVASHIGCGGGGTTQTQSSSSPSTPGTKAVTVTVTGTSGTLQHSSSVTVTIPQ